MFASRIIKQIWPFYNSIQLITSMVIVNVKMPNYMKKQLTAIEDAINLEAIPKCEIKAAMNLDALVG